MSLKEERKEQQQQGNRTIFKAGIRSTRLSQQKTTSVFCVLPAFDPMNPNPASSYLPCVDMDGNPSDYAKFIYVSVFLGHGTMKEDIVSPKTFDREAPCPLEDMYQAVYGDKNTWQYLVKDDDAKGSKKCFTRPSPQLVVNALDRNQMHLGSQLGLLSKSAGNALIDLSCARNSNPQLLQMAAEPGKYLFGFANGDITDPNGCTVLTCGIPPAAKNGDFSAYVVAPLIVDNPMTKQRETQSIRLTPELMQMRYNLMNPESYIEPKSYEEIVRKLVSLYNKRSPSGVHEYHLLKTAFPDYQDLVPEPPMAPAAGSTVAPGWERPGFNAATTQIPGVGGSAFPSAFTPPTGSFLPPASTPAATFAPPVTTFTPPAFTPPAFVPPQAPVTGAFAPPSSERAKLQKVADEPVSTSAAPTQPIAPGDPIPPYPGTMPQGDLSKVLASIGARASGNA